MIIIYLDRELFLKHKIHIVDVLADNPIRNKQMAVKFLKIQDKIETYVKFINLNDIELFQILDWIDCSSYSPLIQEYIVI